MPTWLLNSVTLVDYFISGAKLTFQNMQPDVLSFTQNVAWDGGVEFSSSTPTLQTLTLNGEVVFTGYPRTVRRFIRADGEGFEYELRGPWDWLQRRALRQQTAVVVDPATSTVPTLIPQGLVLLYQDDGGLSVSIAATLALILDQAIAAGVPIQRGTITGFDYYSAWDEVADLTYADAITRVLASAPDAVVWWDYTTGDPTCHIGRRANLDAISLALAPRGASAVDIMAGSYASFVGSVLETRGDLVVPFVEITYRRINTFNGVSYLSLETDSAGTGTADSDNALVRTVQLAGSSYTATTLEQRVEVRALSGSLTASGTITEAGAPGDFAELLAFWRIKHSFLDDAGVTVTEFRECLRSPTDRAATLLDALNSEIVAGGYAPWMSAVTVQDQTYSVEVAFTKTINGAVIADRQLLTAGVLASNAETRTYTHLESSSYTPPEPAPTGLAASLHAALSVIHYEGSFTLTELEPTLAARPGVKINFSGGRAAWASMNAVVQQMTLDIDSSTTVVQLGFPAHLGPVDLVEICRANRLRRPAEQGLIRTTGVY